MKPISIYAGVLLAGTLLSAEEPRLINDPYLAQLRTEAINKHPAASAGKLRAAAARQDVRGVRLWDDPMVGLSVMAAEKMMREDDGDIRVMFEQSLPKPGLYQANLAKAEASGRAELEVARTSSLEVGAAAARDAIELALADESIALQRGQLKWLSTMAENARQAALNPGKTSVDALRLETELARENQILVAAQRTREGVAQRLNLRLGRKLNSSWPILKLTLSPAPIPIASAEIARIPHANPRVRAMKEMAKAANAETRIVDRERQPQFSVGLESELYSGGDFRSAAVGLKMSLPYFNRTSYAAKVDAAHLRENAAVQDIEMTRLEVAAAVLNAVTEVANAAAQARAYSGDIYDRALTATQIVEGSWISSTMPLTDVLESNRSLFSIRLEQRRFVAMQLVALEELNLLVPNRR